VKYLLLNKDLLSWQAKPTFPPNKATLAFASIPFGTSGEDWDTAWGADEIEKCISNLKHNLPRSDRVFRIIIGCTVAQASWVWESLELHGTHQPDILFWHKDNLHDSSPSANVAFGSHVEMFIVGFVIGAETQKRDAYCTDENDRCNLMRFDTPTRFRDAEKKMVNSTQTSVQFCRRLLQCFSKPGDWVYDLLGGSGSFTVAAILEQRNCIYADNRASQINGVKQRLAVMKTNRLKSEYDWEAIN
jgi:hypothetical protein